MYPKSRQITSLTEEVVFAIEGTTLSLAMSVNRAVSIDKTALRTAIYYAYEAASNLIDGVGDGDLPASQMPYKVVNFHAYIRLDGDVQAHRKLRWSDVKDILWGLRKFMILQGNSFRMAFMIIEEGQERVLGYGRVLEGEPLPPPLTSSINSSGILELPS